MTALKYLLFVFTVTAMLLPGLQQTFHLTSEKTLSGDFILTEEPVFSVAAWMEGSFQNQYNNYLEEHIGFRPFLVRLDNQIDFSFYRKANADGVLIGKDDFLYEYDYIRAYTGTDFVGEQFIAEKMNRFKFIQAYLKDSLNIDLVLVFEPGKASFYPEYIPDRYLTVEKPRTNYKVYLQTAQKLGVNYVDFNHYFLKLKDKSQYPLFPKYGTHWSVYGMSFAADSILKTIEKVRSLNLSEVTIDQLKISEKPLETDDDVEKPMNLLLPLPSTEELAYPVFEFEIDPMASKPMVLAVADSYYWNFYNTRIPQKVFANEAFWYFNAKVYPDFYTRPVYVKNLNLQQEIEKQDVIFLMVTERFLYKFDWGFVDDVYRLYAPPELQLPVYSELNKIIKDEVWFASMIQTARKKQQQLDSTLWAEATYQFKKRDKLAYLKEFGSLYYAEIITNDSAWSAGISRKAKSKNISYEKMLNLDADYMFKNNHPELYKEFEDIRQRESIIRNDSLLLEQARAFANYYCCSLERAIEYKAKALVAE